MADRYRTVLLFGAPGAGKGTQGNILGEIPGFHHFSTGDMFRELDPASDLGRTFLGCSTRGELVPDEVTVSLWEKTVAAHRDSGLYHPDCELLVLDGMPRNVTQTRLLKDLVDVLAIVVLDADDPNQLLDRLCGRALTEGRPDDAEEEVIRRRLAIYEQETEPVLSCYPAAIVHKIDPIGLPARVLVRVLDVLVPIQESMPRKTRR